MAKKKAKSAAANARGFTTTSVVVKKSDQPQESTNNSSKTIEKQRSAASEPAPPKQPTPAAPSTEPTSDTWESWEEALPSDPAAVLADGDRVASLKVDTEWRREEDKRLEAAADTTLPSLKLEPTAEESLLEYVLENESKQAVGMDILATLSF
ncbi:hypothetical protein HK102_004884 [Quaeritorhiza haematococci]|nr:hypothetical protein HK102_004884 [Quaeritorhiza haematococci]